MTPTRETHRFAHPAERAGARSHDHERKHEHVHPPPGATAHDRDRAVAAPARPTRRRVLLAGAAIGATALAGCLESDDAATASAEVEPISLAGRTCDGCGMVIDDHYGPAGQLFWADDPEDEPAGFDSVTELVAAHDERVAGGATLRAAFVTDYSSVDYDLEERDGTRHVSRHVEEAAFEDATGLSFVVDGDVHGAMGPDHLPFSRPADAEAFADDHGGDVVAWEDLVADGS